MARLIRTFVTVILCACLATPGYSAEETKTAAKNGPRKQLAVIVFSGLGGAVLGLSTLSFYGRPQDYLANIAIGFALGIIGGTIYSTYRAAAQPREFYGTPEEGALLRKELYPSGAEPGLLIGKRWAF